MTAKMPATVLRLLDSASQPTDGSFALLGLARLAHVAQTVLAQTLA